MARGYKSWEGGWGKGGENAEERPSGLRRGRREGGDEAGRESRWAEEGRWESERRAFGKAVGHQEGGGLAVRGRWSGDERARSSSGLLVAVPFFLFKNSSPQYSFPFFS